VYVIKIKILIAYFAENKNSAKIL